MTNVGIYIIAPLSLSMLHNKTTNTVEDELVFWLSCKALSPYGKASTSPPVLAILIVVHSANAGLPQTLCYFLQFI
jgi:hypothetical protein